MQCCDAALRDRGATYEKVRQESNGHGCRVPKIAVCPNKFKTKQRYAVHTSFPFL